MQYLNSIEELESYYGEPGAAATRKVAHVLTPLYRKWIMASRLCMVSTVGPEGTDGSPRGDEGPVVTELDPRTLAMPDWHGNNRIDTLRNIVRDPRVSLMFMVPGSKDAVRVNGRARVTADEGLRARFARKTILPATVIVIEIAEIYIQCSRALMRSGTWGDRPAPEGVPTLGQIAAEMTNGEEGGEAFDQAWPKRAADGLW